jgi:hypothetical protein
MSNLDFTLPEVAVLHQKARFFKEDGRDFIEISYVGSKETVIHKVKPVHMANYRDEWNAYCDGQPQKTRTGTPLTDLSSIKELRVNHYYSNNVHTLEELAALNDGQVQSLGHGALTEREAARKLLGNRIAEENAKIRDYVTKAAATIGPVPAEKYAGASDLTAVNERIDKLADSVASLVQALQPKKRGPKPKNKEADTQ